MPIVTALGNKLLLGLFGLLVLLNINIGEPKKINANIYGHTNNVFYGDLKINDKVLRLLVEVEEKTVNQNIDKNETTEKHSSNVDEKVTDDKTPGKIKMKIKDERGREVTYERDMGSGEMSDTDKEINKEVADALTKYLNNLKNKPISEGIVDTVKKFVDYCNRDSNSKGWFDKKFSKK
jgi:hypothetical protein